MFLTGEFSKISRVSKRLLHYYDEIGLLKPAHIDPQTGYRYYSAKQLPRLNRILALKELGLTLDHIAGMMQSDVSDEEIHGMLLMKKAEVEQTVLEEVQRLRRIEARLQQNQRSEDTLDVVVKSIPAQLFLSIRTILPSPQELLQLVQHVQRILPSRVDPRPFRRCRLYRRIHAQEQRCRVWLPPQKTGGRPDCTFRRVHAADA
jgi:DNA-binding transcriptional MerR regulator